MRGRVHVDREGIRDPLNFDFLIQRAGIIINVIRHDADISTPHRDLMITSGRIRHIRITAVLDVTHNPLHNLRKLNICDISSGMHLHRRTRRALIIRDLSNELGNPVNRETRTIVLLSHGLNVVGPLL